MEDKEKKGGKWSDYNKIPVNQREYYYDRDDMDDESQEFGNMIGDLKKFNKKLQKEVENEKPAKINIEKND